MMCGGFNLPTAVQYSMSQHFVSLTFKGNSLCLLDAKWCHCKNVAVGKRLVHCVNTCQVND